MLVDLAGQIMQGAVPAGCLLTELGLEVPSGREILAYSQNKVLSTLQVPVHFMGSLCRGSKCPAI